jgi:HTH-type transcriptional regulator / antitoxin HigA
MDSKMEKTYAPQSIPHPGETVLDYLSAYEWTQKDLALRSGVTPKTISEICNGKGPISPTTALAFEKVLQRPAHFWLGLQRLYDEYVARSQASEESKSWEDWVAKFPLKEMQRFGYFDEVYSARSKAELLLGFFGVSSPDSWQSVWYAKNVAFRQTDRFHTSSESISAWVRATEVFARRLESEIDVAGFDLVKLKTLISEIRGETRRKAEKAIPRVQELCASVGILFVLVPELPKTGISGCARWLTDSKALIALTLRHKRDDVFWFTFFHELGHIILHRKTHKFIIDNAAETLMDRVVDVPVAFAEEEANRFAADTLIEPEALFEYIRNGEFSATSVERFAKHQNIAPGIVVGRLQYEGIIPRNQGNKFKQVLGWTI